MGAATRTVVPFLQRRCLYAAAVISCVAAPVAGASSRTSPLPSTPASATAAVQATSPARELARAVPPAASRHRELLDRYCVVCHNDRLRTADLVFDGLDLARVGDHADVWEKVVQKLRSGAMPPAGRPSPEGAARNGFASWLEAALDRAAAARPDPGRRPAVHRLNRAEYVNAVRDLVAVEVDPSRLPADNTAYGFDNIADVLEVSPLLFERYLSAAQRISRLAVGDPAIRPAVETYFPDPLARQEARASDEVPFGTRGGLAIRRFFPVDAEYGVKIVLKRTVDLEVPIGLKERQEIDVRLDGAPVGSFTYGGLSVDDDGPRVGREALIRVDESLTSFEFRLPVTAGTHRLAVTFLERTLEPEDLAPRFPTSSVSFLDVDQPLARVERVEVAGPFNVAGAGESPSRRRIFVCRPAHPREEQPCATQILDGLARRAFRRAVTPEDMHTLLEFYETGRREGSFDSGIQAAIERILISPQFLFRIERDPAAIAAGTVYRISDVELASRLSFFLWSSIPDAELLGLAVAGRLRESAVIAQQVQRMLRDARASALVKNFAGQWLHLRNLQHVTPSTNEYPDFDDDLRVALRRETELFFESQLRGDRGVVDLLRADYSFLNERLARHYGIGGVYGSHLRRVSLPAEIRPGLLGHGSILTATSYPNRTSPVERGKWILENILGAPPPAPPANVPPLPEEAVARSVSMRERMEQHRRNPACAVCHAQMDPLGFALENFDGVGRWRARDGGDPIDASGVLPDGTPFTGPAGLRDVLVSRAEEFVTTVTTRMLTYALGRGVEPYDMPAVRTIVREASLNDHRWSSIVLGIVESVPFQMRRSQ